MMYIRDGNAALFSDAHIRIFVHTSDTRIYMYVRIFAVGAFSRTHIAIPNVYGGMKLYKYDLCDHTVLRVLILNMHNLTHIHMFSLS